MEVLGMLIGLGFGVGVWILAAAIAGNTKRRERAWRNTQWPPEVVEEIKRQNRNVVYNTIHPVVINRLMCSAVEKVAKEAQKRIDGYRLEQEEKLHYDLLKAEYGGRPYGVDLKSSPYKELEESSKRLRDFRMQQARERHEEINLIMLANLMRVADHENSPYMITRG